MDRGRVAQLVEQCPFKAWVAGSNPAALTTLFKFLEDLDRVDFGHPRTPRRVSTQLGRRFALSISREISRSGRQDLDWSVHVYVEDILLVQLGIVHFLCRWARHRPGLHSCGPAPGCCPDSTFGFYSQAH